MAWTEEARQKARDTRARKSAPAGEIEAVPLGYDESEGDPPAAAAEPEGGAAPKKRGRPSGGRRNKVDLSGVEQLLYAIHLGLANILHAPELVISDEEAALLRGAAEKVARHYDMPDLPAKMIDWTNLIVALGTVYGTRAIAMRARLETERRAGRAA